MIHNISLADKRAKAFVVIVGHYRDDLDTLSARRQEESPEDIAESLGYRFDGEWWNLPESADTDTSLCVPTGGGSNPFRF